MVILLWTVLIYLVDALAETSAKDDFISPSGVRGYVDDFNPNERREWEDGIRTCTHRRDWTDPTTHLRLPAATPDVDRTSSETTAERAKQLHSMFRRQYQGDFHKLFVGALNDYENFGRTIPIIQSSGKRKSRMVREIGNDVP